MTVNLISEGLKRLRTIAAESEDAHKSKCLWRGMRHVRMDERFSTVGGTEIAPMSATSDLRVALRYALSSNSLLFKITAKSFMERGADISYLSCFRAENEHLFSPLTYLRPTGRKEVVTSSGMTITVVEVEPSL